MSNQEGTIVDQMRIVVTGAGSLWRSSQRLSHIREGMDWACFDRYLRWLDVSETGSALTAHQLFRALLLQQWYALVAAEFEYLLSDSASCRSFVGLGTNDPAPSHIDICRFRRLLINRGMIEPIYEELAHQLEALGRFEDVEAMPDTSLIRSPDNRFDTRSRTRLLGPDAWRQMEDRFTVFWRRCAGRGALPALDAVTLSHVPDLMPHMTLLRRLADDDDYLYEWVGSAVIAGNQGSAIGHRIGDKIRDNLIRYNHPGLQGEMKALLDATVADRNPTSTMTYYLNSGGRNCQVKSVQAPLGRHDGTITHLLGLFLVHPI